MKDTVSLIYNCPLGKGMIQAVSTFHQHKMDLKEALEKAYNDTQLEADEISNPNYGFDFWSSFRAKTLGQRIEARYFVPMDLSTIV